MWSLFSNTVPEMEKKCNGGGGCGVARVCKGWGSAIPQCPSASQVWSLIVVHTCIIDFMLKKVS